MKSVLNNSKLGLTLAAIFWLVAIFSVRADFSADAGNYRNGGQCFLDAGLACNYIKEPLYPLFLSVLLKLNFDLSIFVPFFQNVFFLIATIFFVREVFFIEGRYEHVLKVSIYTAFVPTFLITMNGAVYTESLSASLIMTQMALLARGFKGLREKQPVWGQIALYITIACGSGVLVLLKGSFLYIQIGFSFLLIFGYLVRYFMRGCSSVKVQSIIPMILALVLGGLFAQQGWFAIRSSLPENSFYRGGIILYGRTEYAKQFNWKKDFVPFVIAALSDKGCQIFYGDQCELYTFQAENDLGYSALQTATDAELFNLGKENILRQPLLQLLFVPMEWMRFLLHHGTTGFARLEIPVLGALLHSFLFNVILKIFNLGLYIYLSIMLWKGKISFSHTTGLLLAYTIAFLSVYGFVSTVVRMIYPIAPFMIVMSFQYLLSIKTMATHVH